ncbi:DUF998 domain-containing protein [Streptomyces sp. NPDC038707]|uniref:DUF998 domain-containing protein n=1 Tax=Streptomyces sp. NPDC038707 TaxID=3154329 RepID=UPI0033F08CE3
MIRLRQGRRLAGIPLALTAVLYNAWISAPLLVAGADPLHTYVSDLSAGAHPHSLLFRTADLMAGACAVAAAVLALGGRTARLSWARAGWWALGLFGAATAVEFRFPLSCPLVADRACFDREVAGLAPAAHTVHTVTSAVATAAALAAMTALTIAARRYGWWPALARHGRVLVVAQWAVNVWLMVAVAAFMTRHVNLWVGGAERLQELLLACWALLLAAGVVRSGAAPLAVSRPPAPRPSAGGEPASHGVARVPARRPSE